MEQLLFLPRGTQMFDRLCIVAHSPVLTSALLSDEYPIDEMPSVLYTSLQQETTDKVEAQILSRKATLCRVLVSTVGSMESLTNVPSENELVSYTKQNHVSQEVMLARGEGQSLESYEEQFACFDKCKCAIDKYALASTTFTKCRGITGGPGCGKTFVMNAAALYGVSQGLCVMITCLLAKRADVLGGIHVHSLFAIPVHEDATVQRLAELAVINLYKSPERLALLQRLDILFGDEFGQWPSELVSCIDMILRRVRGSNQFMGGVLFIGTIDQLQLRPIKGHPFLLSPFVLTCFRFSVLTKSVRAADDLYLQRIEDISQMLTHEYTHRRF
jgi:predicted ATPase